METTYACIPCMLKAQVHTMQVIGLLRRDPALAERIYRESLRMLAGDDWSRPAIRSARALNKLLMEAARVPDPYGALRAQSNAAALAHVPAHRALLHANAAAHAQSREEQLRCALSLSAAGNVVDFTAEVQIALDDALRAAVADRPMLAVDDTAALDAALARAQSLLFVCDNSGEAAFDKLLLERVAELYPGVARVAVACKAAPLLNDVLRADCLDVGFGELAFGPARAPVTFVELGQGDGVGDWPDDPRLLDGYDVVVSKGQANYEAMCGWRRGVFFVLTCKCDAIAASVGGVLMGRVVKQV